MFQEATELAASGFKGAEIVFGVVMVGEQSSALYALKHEIFDRAFSQRRVLVQIADDLASQDRAWPIPARWALHVPVVAPEPYNYFPSVHRHHEVEKGRVCHAEILR